jgi:CheY-like chemotaxis protein
MNLRTENVPLILSVDDSSGDTLLLQEAFGRTTSHAELRVAPDGEAALTLLGKMSPLPQLILLDLKLPRMSGLELLQELKSNERYRSIPIVMLTSSQSPTDITTAYSRDCNAYVLKPSDFSKLVKLAQLINDFWLEAIQPPPVLAK